MRIAIRKLGNSSGVIIPKILLGQIGVDVGDSVELTVDDGRILMAPVRKSVRAGWAQASAEIAAGGDDHLIWPEFGNADDEELEW